KRDFFMGLNFTLTCRRDGADARLQSGGCLCNRECGPSARKQLIRVRGNKGKVKNVLWSGASLRLSILVIALLMFGSNACAQIAAPGNSSASSPDAPSNYVAITLQQRFH